MGCLIVCHTAEQLYHFDGGCSGPSINYRLHHLLSNTVAGLGYEFADWVVQTMTVCLHVVCVSSQELGKVQAGVMTSSVRNPTC